MLQNGAWTGPDGKTRQLIPQKWVKEGTDEEVTAEDEINDDFERFIRHEAMRANITQEEVIEIIGLMFFNK